jgi:hypothetical protein
MRVKNEYLRANVQSIGLTDGGKVIVDGREDAMRKDAFTGLVSNG